MSQWDTLLDTDPIFATWVHAQIGKAGVDCSTYKADNETLRITVNAQQKRINELEQDRKQTRTRR